MSVILFYLTGMPVRNYRPLNISFESDFVLIEAFCTCLITNRIESVRGPVTSVWFKIIEQINNKLRTN